MRTFKQYLAENIEEIHEEYLEESKHAPKVKEQGKVVDGKGKHMAAKKNTAKWKTLADVGKVSLVLTGAALLKYQKMKKNYFRISQKLIKKAEEAKSSGDMHGYYRNMIKVYRNAMLFGGYDKSKAKKAIAKFKQQIRDLEP